MGKFSGQLPGIFQVGGRVDVAMDTGVRDLPL